MKRLITFIGMGVALNYALGGVSGCSSADPVKKSAPAVGKLGTLDMALETVSDSGKVYRLRNALFLVETSGVIFDTNGGGKVGSAGVFGGGPVVSDGGVFPLPGAGGSPAFPDGGFGGFTAAGGSGAAGGIFSTGGSPGTSNSFFLSSEDNPDSAVIEKFLAPGGYDIDLFDGWFVERIDNLLGTSTPVPATLDSSPFQFFNIASDKDTFVKFNFTVDGSQVTFGPPGRLTIGIGVHETIDGQGVCGNGIAENGEECDGADLRGASCASATMGALPFGSLFCSGNCFFDASFCTSAGIFDGGAGGFGGGTGGSPAVDSGTAGSVGFPTADAGMVGAGGASGKTPIP